MLRVLGGAVIVTIAVAIAFELLLRVVLTYHLDYYTLHRSPGRYELPYGTVLVNSLGYPDEEFDLEDPRPRVGYIGDSVVWGTGAGQGYRISDRLREARPGFQHLTLSSMADGPDVEVIEEIVEQLSLDTVVYFLNLNDVIPPKKPGAKAKVDPVRQLALFARRHLDGLRGVSYLFNYSRARLRNVLQRHGYVASGRRGIEFYPSEAAKAADLLASKVNRAHESLQARGIGLCVLILPYEMQISASAEQRYRELGLAWDDEFIDRGTQDLMLERIDPSIEVADAYFAFIRSEHVEEDRTNNPLGEFFVFDRGDKIDYNHPTRVGHERISNYLLERGFCADRGT